MNISSTISGAEQLGFCGLRHRLDQARRRVGDRWRSPADNDGPTLMGAGNAVRKHLERQLGDPIRIEPEHEGEERLAHAGTHDLAGDRQIHGVREHARGVVGKHLAPQHHDLRALRHDAERGRNRPPHHLSIRPGASHDPEAWQA